MLTIKSGAVLTPDGLQNIDIAVVAGRIETAAMAKTDVLDASGLLVLPGLIDIHGDAFERQIMPRPGVHFDIATALRDTDKQLAANGITTAYHGVTSSWEPGLRGMDNARALVRAIRALRGRTLCDMRLHLRHETFNVSAADETIGWILDGLVDALAFNDHMRGIVLGQTIKATKLKTMVERSGLNEAEFMAHVERTLAQEASIAPSLERLADAARKKGAPLLSHDDRDVEDRAAFRALGCAISEFPMSREAAQDAVGRGEMTVFGAPNVVRGGSHTNCPAAADMFSEGLCSILASDYYYPALLAAPFHLVRSGQCGLLDAWRLVSANPAAALGLDDRGAIAPGRRADALLVDVSNGAPSLIATIAGGEIVWMTDWRRLRTTQTN